MRNNRFKSAHTAKRGNHPSRATLFKMFLVVFGFIGMFICGSLMDSSLAPDRAVASRASSEYGFNSLTNSLVIPGFILSVFMFACGVYSLYKLYHQLHNPKYIRNRSRRTPK